MDDEAILASLDRDPDAFAAFYRRHAGELLDRLEARLGDRQHAAAACAEAFAVALERPERFDPERGSAADWLDAIAARGAARRRAQQRLGIAQLELRGGDRERFLSELEEELLAAARLRASRRWRRRPAAVRAALAGLAALGLIAAAIVLAGGGEDEPGAARAPSGFVMQLAPMLQLADCPGLVARDEPSAEAMPDLALLTYRPHSGDELAPDTAAGLPVGTFERTETRLARAAGLHVVPSLAVSGDTGCAPDDGPGICLVLEVESVFRCFRLADVRSAQALARTPDGRIVGVVPDAIGRVTLSAGGRSEDVRVADNVYEAELGVPSGSEVGIEVARPDADSCAREVAPGLLARNATLRRPPPQGMRLPASGPEAIRRRRWDAVLEDAARYWGRAGELDVWVVPVVQFGSEACAPATAACVVVFAEQDAHDAHCAPAGQRERDTWRLTPLLAGRASIYGIVRDGVVGARVTIGGQTAAVGASDNVLAGVLPFPYRDTAPARVELIRRPMPALPRVGLVDAGGDVRAAIERLQVAGYEPLGTIVQAVRAPDTAVFWRPQQLTREEARGVAYAVGAGKPVRIEGGERTPLPVLDSPAPVVVVVGG